MALAVSLLVMAAIGADPEPPLVGRPSEHFYNVVADRLVISMTASRRDLRVEDELVLVIEFGGLMKPVDVRRPDLRDLPEFSTSFHIDDLEDDATPPSDRRRYRYRLRPKNSEVAQVPPFVAHYWQPKQGYFATTLAEPIPLTVRPRISEAAGVPMTEPDFLFEFADRAEVLADQPPESVGSFLLALLLPGVAALAGFLYWRAAYPDAARQAELRRNRAARLAIDALRRESGPVSVDSANRVLDEVRKYLHHRLEIADRMSTPEEVRHVLASRGIPSSLVAGVAELFRACDCVRFGPAWETVPSLSQMAQALVIQFEEQLQSEVRPSRRWPGSVLLLWLAVNAMASANSAADRTQAAEDHFREGVRLRNNDLLAREQFRLAAESYGVVDGAVPGAVGSRGWASNASRASLLSGNTPAAITLVRAALLRYPGDPDLTKVLQYARGKVAYASAQDRADLTPRKQRLAPLIHRCARTSPLQLGAIAVVGWAGLLAWRVQRRRRWLVIGVGALVLGGTIFGWHLIVRPDQPETRREVAVLAKETVIRVGDGVNFSPRRENPLPAGVEVRVLKQSEWLQVELLDQTRGWIPADSLVPVR